VIGRAIVRARQVPVATNPALVDAMVLCQAAESQQPDKMKQYKPQGGTYRRKQGTKEPE
jgi:hypothetical protein